MKHLIVINNFSNSNKKSNIINKDIIEEKFKGLDYEVYETEPNRKTVTFVDKFLTDHENETVRVYACGGDGTVHEVANALVNHKNAELAIIPMGTGNDFVKTYGGKDKFLDISKSINCVATPIDLSKIESASLKEPYYSINVTNFGFDAIVGAMGNYYKDHGYPEKAKKKGQSPYDYALNHDAMKHGRFNNIEVFADGEKLNKKKMLLCTLAQGKYVGGQFYCAPKSDNTDGLIDVCLIKTMPLIHFGIFVKPYTNGKHLDKSYPKIIYRRAKQVKVTAPEEIDLCVDGEMIKGKEFFITSLPKAIKLVIPE